MYEPVEKLQTYIHGNHLQIVIVYGPLGKSQVKVEELLKTVPVKSKMFGGVL